MRVVVLNADYTFLNLVNTEKAMRLIATGKAIAEKVSDKVMRTVTREFLVPLVIRLTYLVRQIFKRKVPWSKRNIMIRDGYKCVYCGKTDCKVDIDHVFPKSKGGKNTWENCVTSCIDCNRKKADRTPSEANMFYHRKGWRPTQPTVMEFIQIFYVREGLSKLLEDLY